MVRIHRGLWGVTPCPCPHMHGAIALTACPHPTGAPTHTCHLHACLPACLCTCTKLHNSPCPPTHLHTQHAATSHACPLLCMHMHAHPHASHAHALPCMVPSHSPHALTPPVHPPTHATYTCPLLRVSALHYSARDRVSGGFQTVASARALRQLTSCRSEYFYNQRPRVRNLIGTERSLNRSEHRVKREAS